jgi:hypothetical protein
MPHFLDIRLTDGREVVILTRRPRFAAQEDSWYAFLLEAESTPGRLKGLDELKTKSNDLIWNQTRDLAAFGILPQPSSLPRAPDRIE